MKIRVSILWLVFAVAVLIVLVLWHEKKQPMETPVGITTIPPAGTAPIMPSQTNVSASPVVSNNAMPVASQSVPSASQDKITLLKTILQANDVDITFYGRLEDQSGNAVTGAQVKFSIQYENGNSRGIQQGQVVSDDNGFFTISGTGANLGIVPQKAGYALATTDTSYRYSQLTPGYFVPDANNPTVIKMWKLQGAEPLVSINQHYQIHYTETPINFDLLAGKIVPSGGDIRITVNRAPGIISGRNRLDWGVQVEAVNGGIMDSGGLEGVTYAAPESGYEPKMAFVFSSNPPYKWFEEFSQGFFVMSRGGQAYSKLGFSFRINDDPDGFMYVTFSGVANANGSRNWEATSPQ